MKVFKLKDQSLLPAFGIQMASVDAFSGTGGVGAGYGVIEPEGVTAFHRHDECELFAILEGDGVVEADGGDRIAVGPGDLVAISPFDKHVLRNTGSGKLVFATAYWRDAKTAMTEAENGASAQEEVTNPAAEAPCFVFSTPPTPNGDLHLGHLSGPYFGADVFARFQRLLGKTAFHITGSDDFQSYVIAKGRQLNKTPQEVADHFSREITETLDLLDVQIDQFTLTSHAPDYERQVKAFFQSVASSDSVQRRADSAAFDPTTDAYLYECDIKGRCPTCGSGSGGNICEECGEPNLAYDMLDPVSTQTGATPVVRPCERYAIALNDFSDHILGAMRESKASARLQALAERVLAREDFHVPITHPQNWGISPGDPDMADQVFWVWPEMSFGFLYGIEALGQRTGHDWKALEPQDNWKFVHFFGYDNSFYHTILYPALYKAAFPDWHADIEYHVNEFLCLEGDKFSTSRQRAVWGKEVLTPETVDCVRFHLALTRGEVERTNFSVSALQATNRDLIEEWQGWLQALGVEVLTRHDGVAPDAGDWSVDHQAFLQLLEQHRQQIETAYGSAGFSLNKAADTLRTLVRDTIRFAKANRHLAGHAAAADRHRTTIALQLAAVRLLSDASAPLMPRFSEALRKGLGLDPASAWPQTVELLPAGSRVTLSDQRFFSEKVGENVAPIKVTDAA